MLSPAEILGAKGPLAQRIPGFAPRVQQQEMAEAVAHAIEAKETLVVEAGTGTGKTFAYLVPALLSGEKVIVSTGTRNLQDQLFHKDLPIVREALGVPAEVALLKGRGNYLCHHRLDLALSEGRLRSRDMVDALVRVREWSGRTRSGDIAEMDELGEGAAIWPLVTSTADNCLGADCGQFTDCFLAKARRRAQEADLLVVNHHLLLADMALREEGFGELLPGANAFILDEAHQLPETASAFFGIAVTGNQLIGLARDALAEDLKSAGELPIRDECDRLERCARDLRLALGEGQRRAPWRQVAERPAVVAAAQEAAEALAELTARLEPLAPRSRGLENCFRRCRDTVERLHLVTEAAPEGYIHWFETFTRSFSIHLTPLDVADQFRQQMARPGAWIFTSATLAVGGRFDHFAARLGMEEPTSRCYDSPFDFPSQGLFFVPRGLPDPSSEGYTTAVVETALPVLQASSGRAFLLFTSYRALNEAAELLRVRSDFPLFIQGDAPRAHLLEQFRASGNGVLLGTGSFWEGVDVRGEALSCVIIDKLPFASPGDPVLQARIDALRARGGNPFVEHQLPQAVITLKQGVGRLIRDVTDRGVLVVCDPRLLKKSYGHTFLNSLPPMARTRDIEMVQAFFAE